MVTLDDVAARAGVSRMTASNALRGKTIVRPETARKVIAAADELGYHPKPCGAPSSVRDAPTSSV